MRKFHIGLLALVSVIALSGCNKKKAASFAGELTYFYDAFDLADGSALSSNWLVSPGSLSSGDVQVNDGKAQFLNSSFQWIYSTYQTPIDSLAYSISATYSVSGGDLDESNSPRMAIMAGMDENDIAEVTQYIICGIFAGDTAALYTSAGGSLDSDSTPFDITDGSTINVSYQNDGAGNVTCTVTDGTQLVTLNGTLSTSFGQYVGFGGGTGASGENYLYVDDFTVVSLE